jgi:hypothetical protein
MSTKPSKGSLTKRSDRTWSTKPQIVDEPGMAERFSAAYGTCSVGATLPIVKTMNCHPDVIVSVGAVRA